MGFSNFLMCAGLAATSSSGVFALPLRADFGWLRAWTTSLTLQTVPSVDLLAPSWLLRRRLTDWVAVAIAAKEDVNLTTFAVWGLV